MNIGNKIKKLRERTGITRESLASQLSVKTNDIISWEKNEILPNIQQTQKLAQIFGVSIDDLISSNELKDHVNTINITTQPQVNMNFIKPFAIIVFVITISIFIFDIIGFFATYNSVTDFRNEITTSKLNCSINDKTYYYTIDKTYTNAIKNVTGDTYIFNDYDINDFTYLEEIEQYIEDYFSREGGSCKKTSE